MKKYILSALILFIQPVYSIDLLPTHTTILTREDFRGARYTTVGDVLNNVLSINIEKLGSQGSENRIKMRGASTAKHVQVLIDGRSMSHEYDYQVDLSQIPLAIVERIEITRGGSSVSYGAQAIGGTINIVTGHPEKDGLDAEGRTGVGRHGTKAHQGRVFGRSNIADVSYMGAKEESSGFQLNQNYKHNTNFAKFTRSFNGHGYWGAEYFHQESRLGLSNGTPVPFQDWNGKLERIPSTYTPQQTQETQFARVHVASPEVSSTTVYLSYTYGLRDVQQRDGTDGIDLEDQDALSFTLNGSIKHKGFEIGAERRELRRDVRPFQVNLSQQNGIFILNKWEGEKWALLPGFRYDHVTNIGGIANPRMVVVYNPIPPLTISGSASKAFRAPTFNELFVSTDNIHNPDLDPERSQNYDLGFLWRSSNTITFGITGFYSRVDDLISLNSIAGKLSNFGFEENMGLETQASFSASIFELNGQWTYQRSRRSIFNGQGLVPTALTPHHLIFAQFVQNLPWQIKSIFELQHQSKQFLGDNETGLATPSYTIYNLRFQAQTLRAKVFFEIENLFETQYSDSIATFVPKGGTLSNALIPQPNRTFWTGVSIRFSN